MEQRVRKLMTMHQAFNSSDISKRDYMCPDKKEEDNSPASRIV